MTAATFAWQRNAPTLAERRYTSGETPGDASGRGDSAAGDGDGLAAGTSSGQGGTIFSQ